MDLIKIIILDMRKYFKYFMKKIKYLNTINNKYFYLFMIFFMKILFLNKILFKFFTKKSFIIFTFLKNDT